MYENFFSVFNTSRGSRTFEIWKYLFLSSFYYRVLRLEYIEIMIKYIIKSIVGIWLSTKQIFIDVFVCE